MLTRQYIFPQNSFYLSASYIFGIWEKRRLVLCREIITKEKKKKFLAPSIHSSILTYGPYIISLIVQKFVYPPMSRWGKTQLYICILDFYCLSTHNTMAKAWKRQYATSCVAHLRLLPRQLYHLHLPCSSHFKLFAAFSLLIIYFAYFSGLLYIVVCCWGSL